MNLPTLAHRLSAALRDPHAAGELVGYTRVPSDPNRPIVVAVRATTPCSGRIRVVAEVRIRMPNRGGALAWFQVGPAIDAVVRVPGRAADTARRALADELAAQILGPAESWLRSWASRIPTLPEDLVGEPIRLGLGPSGELPAGLDLS